jgi:hypothetical protein
MNPEYLLPPKTLFFGIQWCGGSAILKAKLKP